MKKFINRILTNGRVRRVIVAVFDALCFIAVTGFYYLATIIPTGTLLTNVEPNVFFIDAAMLFVLMGAARICCGIYMSLWRYTSTSIYFKLIISDGFSSIIAAVAARVIGINAGIWFFITIGSMTALATLLSRFAYRLLYKRANAQESGDIHKIPIAIIGAGQVGALLADELLANKKSNYRPVFFIDHDSTKTGSRIAGLKVYPENEDIISFIESQAVSELFVAISGLTSDESAKLYEFYSRTSCKIKLYDAVQSVDSSEFGTKRQIREFKIEDLLFRKSLDINDTTAKDYYSGKTILVTGGGGSIGSELCRQIAKCSPKKLIILDIYENNAYDIQQELIRQYRDGLDLSVEIASVRDRKRLECVFASYRPDIVFHAAAHKHVPLMEHSNCEAIKNNILGTYNTADMAEKYGTGKFILVSTDKAVNPTNIMGASKRMCEMVIQCRTDSKTSFAAVRFGNVLGSNGSVIPLFRRQIAGGGPITITDKRIIRYFMTIPEASQLVMQAGAMAKRGELFVLDMGKPIKIYDLAVNMIRLSGLEPGTDIKIEEIGLRPGEKLYEELLIKTETLDKTDNNMIFVEKDTPLSRAEVDEKIAILTDAVEKAKDELESPIIRKAFFKAVPTYHDPKVVNRKAEEAEEMKMAAEDAETEKEAVPQA